jgi:hypothetical protein
VYDVRHEQPDFERGPDGARRATGSLLPVLIVVGFIVAVVVGLVALTGLAGLYIVLAVSGVLGFAAVHYVLWGWWLTNKLRRDEPPVDDPSE